LPHETAPARSLPPLGPSEKKRKKKKEKQNLSNLPLPTSNRQPHPTAQPNKPKTYSIIFSLIAILKHKHLLQTKFRVRFFTFLFAPNFKPFQQIIHSPLPHPPRNHLSRSFDSRRSIPTQKKCKNCRFLLQFGTRAVVVKTSFAKDFVLIMLRVPFHASILVPVQSPAE
jgi:hypothetical protein